MNYDDQGHGPPVLMIPGLGGTAESFEPQAQVLRRTFRIIRPDLPGTGQARASGACALDEIVEDLADLARSLESGPVHWVGHSLGSLLSRQVALRHPDMVASLSLIGPVWLVCEGMRAGLVKRAQRVRSKGMAEFVEEYLRSALSKSTASVHPAAMQQVRNALLDTVPEVYASYCEALAYHSPIETPPLATPTLLLTGDEDLVAPPSAVRLMAASFLQPTLRELESCGHWATLEAPENVTVLLLSHLVASAARLPVA